MKTVTEWIRPESLDAATGGKATRWERHWNKRHYGMMRWRLVLVDNPNVTIGYYDTKQARTPPNDPSTLPLYDGGGTVFCVLALCPMLETNPVI